MSSDPLVLLHTLDIKTPLVGFYDTPDLADFAPFADPSHCFFSCYENWLQGESVKLSKNKFQCMGSGYWLCNVSSLPRDKFVEFLADKEGLKKDHEVMDKWLDNHNPYQQTHEHIVVGPLKEGMDEYLKTITFFVNPDQLSALLIGTEYNNSSGQSMTKTFFGSGCMQLAPLFDNFDEPQAVIGATDLAMRQHLPSDILALTVTKPMFEQLCQLDEHSFLNKPFLKNLQKKREK